MVASNCAENPPSTSQERMACILLRFPGCGIRILPYHGLAGRPGFQLFACLPTSRWRKISSNFLSGMRNGKHWLISRGSGVKLLTMNANFRMFAGILPGLGVFRITFRIREFQYGKNTDNFCNATRCNHSTCFQSWHTAHLSRNTRNFPLRLCKIIFGT